MMQTFRLRAVAECVNTNAARGVTLGVHWCARRRLSLGMNDMPYVSFDCSRYTYRWLVCVVMADVLIEILYVYEMQTGIRSGRST